jgi:hypothetical protein
MKTKGAYLIQVRGSRVSLTCLVKPCMLVVIHTLDNKHVCKQEYMLITINSCVQAMCKPTTEDTNKEWIIE